MRFRVLAAVWFAVYGAMPLLAQGPLPAPSAAAPVHSHSRAKTAPLAPSAPQAVFDATGLGSPLQLQSNWRVGITSDLAAPSPTFDDSNWAIRNAKPYINDVPEEEDEGPAPPATSGSGSAAKPITDASAQRYAWFRLHIKLAPNHGPVALLIELPVSANASFSLDSTGNNPDIYANGQHIQPEGPHGDAPQRYQLISRIYNLNVPANETSLTLAVRIYYTAFGYGAYTTFFANRTFTLGNPGDLERELNLWSNRSLFERLPRLIYSVLLAVLAVFLFALYFTQKDHTEYLWLALHELAQAPLGFIELAGSSARLNHSGTPRSSSSSSWSRPISSSSFSSSFFPFRAPGIPLAPLHCAASACRRTRTAPCRAQHHRHHPSHQPLPFLRGLDAGMVHLRLHHPLRRRRAPQL